MATWAEQATAYHEAGHFVACKVLGRTVGSMSIVREGDALGQTKLPPDPAVEGNDSLVDREIVILFAGYAGQQRFEFATDGGPACMSWAECFEQCRFLGSALRDVTMAMNMLKGRFGTEPEMIEHLRQVAVIATNVVNVAWPAVERIAQQLAAARTLSEPEGTSLFDASEAKTLVWPLPPDGSK